MASGSVSQGCPPKAAVGAPRLILEAVKIKEAERQEGSGGSRDGEVPGWQSLEGSLSCAIDVFLGSKVIMVRSRRAVLLGSALCVWVPIFW